MDIEQIEVLKTPPFERLLGDRDNMLAIMEGIPELGDDKKILALDEAIIDGALHTLAGFLLVSVVWWPRKSIFVRIFNRTMWRDIPKAPSNSL